MNKKLDFSCASVMVVDDTLTNLVAIEIALEALGVQNIFTVSSGEAAVKLFQKIPEKIDMIFMDQEMPGMNGIETMQAIRALSHPRAADLPIISTTSNPELIAECRAAGMAGHVRKSPIVAAEWEAALEEHIAPKVNLRELKAQAGTLNAEDIDLAKDVRLAGSEAIEKNSLAEKSAKSVNTRDAAGGWQSTRPAIG